MDNATIAKYIIKCAKQVRPDLSYDTRGVSFGICIMSYVNGWQSGSCVAQIHYEGEHRIVLLTDFAEGISADILEHEAFLAQLKMTIGKIRPLPKPARVKPSANW